MRVFGGLVRRSEREFVLTAAGQRLASARVRGPAVDVAPEEETPAPAFRPAYFPGFVQRFPFSVRSSTPFAPAVISPDRSPPQFGTSEWPEPPDFVAATDSERDEAELSEDEKACYSFSKNFGPCKDCEDACLDTAACQSDTKRQHICHFCGGPHKGIWCVDDEKKAEFKARAKALKAKRQRTSKMPNGDHEHYWESDGWDGEGGWGDGDNASAWGSPVKPPSAKKGKGDDEKGSGKYGSKKGSDEKGSKKGEDKGSKGKGRGGKGRGKGERVEMSKEAFEGLLEAAAGKALEKAEAQRYAEGAAGEWPQEEEEEEKGAGAGAANAWDSSTRRSRRAPVGATTPSRSRRRTTRRPIGAPVPQGIGAVRVLAPLPARAAARARRPVARSRRRRTRSTTRSSGAWARATAACSARSAATRWTRAPR